MRKLMSIFAVALLFAGCGDDEVNHRALWRVVNRSGHTIRVVPPPYGNFSTVAYDRGTEWELRLEDYGTEYTFEMFRQECWRDWAEGNISFEVLSEDGTVLARWNYSGRNEPGKQFFNPSSWRHTVDESDFEISHTWLFEIRPEDLD